MQYELTIKLRVETSVDEARVARQVESLFACGTASEAFAEALKLNEDPRFVGMEVLASPA